MSTFFRRSRLHLLCWREELLMQEQATVLALGDALAVIGSMCSCPGMDAI